MGPCRLVMGSTVSESVLEESQRAMESGIVTFLYRPKVGMEEVDKLQGVQRFYILLEPKQQQQQFTEELESAAKERTQDHAAAAADKEDVKGSSMPTNTDQLQQEDSKTSQDEDAGPSTRSRKRKQQQVDSHAPDTTHTQAKMDQFVEPADAKKQPPDSHQEADAPASAHSSAAGHGKGTKEGQEEGVEGRQEEKEEKQEQEQQEHQPQARLLVVPKKRLPDGAKHERFYAFVEAVGDSTHSLTSGLTATSYETKTRGHREQGAARVVGEGSYLLTQQGPRGATQLVYKVLVPPKPGPAQATFKLGTAGSFLIKAKNPEHRGPGAPSLGTDPSYSEPQRKKFKGASWTDADPSLLSTTAAELLLIGTRDEPSGASEELLEEVYLSDAEEGPHHKQVEDPTALADHLREHVEPEGQGGRGSDAVPLTPALTGEMV